MIPGLLSLSPDWGSLSPSTLVARGRQSQAAALADEERQPTTKTKRGGGLLTAKRPLRRRTRRSTAGSPAAAAALGTCTATGRTPTCSRGCLLLQGRCLCCAGGRCAQTHACTQPHSGNAHAPVPGPPPSAWREAKPTWASLSLLRTARPWCGRHDVPHAFHDLAAVRQGGSLVRTATEQGRARVNGT